MISKVKIVNLFDLGVSSHSSDLLSIIVDILCDNIFIFQLKYVHLCICVLFSSDHSRLLNFIFNEATFGSARGRRIMGCPGMVSLQ